MLRLPFGGMHLCVFGEVEHHWSWSAGACYIESPAHSPCHIFWFSNLITPFRYRLCHTHQVYLLECICAEHSYPHLSGYHHHRSGVHHGICHTCQCVGGTGSAGHQAYAHVAAHPCISFSGMGSRLLVSYQYVVEGFLFASRIIIECIKDWHDGTTGVSKNCGYTLVDKGSHQRFCTCYRFFIHYSLWLFFSSLDIVTWHH